MNYKQRRVVFAQERSRIANDRELVSGAVKMARCGESYYDIFQYLTPIPIAPRNARTYLESFCLEAWEAKAAYSEEMRKKVVSVAHHAAWLKSMGCTAEHLIELLDVNKSTLAKLMMKINRMEHETDNWEETTCLRCDRKFKTPDKRYIRICQTCKKQDTIYCRDAWGVGRLLTP